MSTETFTGDKPDGPTVPKDGFDSIADQVDLDGDPRATARSHRALEKAHNYLAKFGEASGRNLWRLYELNMYA